MLIDLLKISIPAIVVALTAYYLLRSVLRQQNAWQMLQRKSDDRATTLPLQLQAYERLSVLCERLAIPGLVLRTEHQQMQAATLRIALLIAIQQEFEHNISQQIYVSDQLWAIVQATRDDAAQFVEMVSEKVDGKEPAPVLAKALLLYTNQRDGNPVATAQMAIRREAANLFA